MKKIILHGILKKHFCESFAAKAENIKDLFKALAANFPNYSRSMQKIQKHCSGLALILDGQLFHKDVDFIDSELLAAKTIEIIPCSKICIFSSLAAILVSIGVQAIVAKVIAFVLIVAISIGISFLVSSLMKPGDPKQLKTSSYIFASQYNISARNTAIPISYGRLKANSSIISAFLLSFDLEYIRTQASSSPQTGSVFAII